jgi:pimeloyl-ACP methyl ester carboxylesterase
VSSARRRLAFLLTVPAALALAGCVAPVHQVTAPTAEQSAQTPPPSAAAGSERFYTQHVSWSSCPRGTEADQCATIEVPLDWAHPEGDTIKLAVARDAATGDNPVGSILVNPGGPGASAVDFLSTADQIVSAEVRDEYDLVAFDPRGVQRSVPVKCYDGPQMDQLTAADFDLSTDAGVQQQTDAWGAFGKACSANTGAVLGHVDTVSSARDMDVVRALVGDPKLNYLGYSYGTKLGATYAGLFPTTVGRMVLDSALDPTLDGDQLAAGQAAGFESALRAYTTSCLSGSKCPMHGSVDQAMSQIKAMLDATHTHPLPTQSGRSLTAPLAFTGIAYPLYSQQAWPQLTTALQAAFAGDGTVLLALSDAYYDRASDGTYTTNTTEAFSAINCLDLKATTDLAQMRAYAAEIEKAAPTVGQFFAYSGTSCAQWPEPYVGGLADYSAKGAPPIVVIGTTNDPATPYVWAQALAKQLSSGVLVTHVGEGHGVYGLGNQCVDNAVDDYFLDGTAPAAGTRC